MQRFKWSRKIAGYSVDGFLKTPLKSYIIEYNGWKYHQLYTFPSCELHGAIENLIFINLNGSKKELLFENGLKKIKPKSASNRIVNEMKRLVAT